MQVEVVSLERENIHLWEGCVCCLPDIFSESGFFSPPLTFSFLGAGVKRCGGSGGRGVLERVCRGIDNCVRSQNLNMVGRKVQAGAGVDSEGIRPPEGSPSAEPCSSS